MAPAELDKLMENPKEANAALGDGKAEALMAQAYRDFVSLPSAREAFRRLFIEIARQDNLPALFHCTTGKDRTGWAAAALLSLLDVPEETVLEDFLRSNDYILPFYQKEIDAWAAAGGDPAIMSALYGVRPQYLEASFDEMRTRYGAIEDYFSKALEIDAAGQKALRDLYLARQWPRAARGPSLLPDVLWAE
jgi:protein-tyrosine phosphatase